MCRPGESPIASYGLHAHLKTSQRPVFAGRPDFNSFPRPLSSQLQPASISPAAGLAEAALERQAGGRGSVCPGRGAGSGRWEVPLVQDGQRPGGAAGSRDRHSHAFTTQHSSGTPSFVCLIHCSGPGMKHGRKLPYWRHLAGSVLWPAVLLFLLTGTVLPSSLPLWRSGKAAPNAPHWWPAGCQRLFNACVDQQQVCRWLPPSARWATCFAIYPAWLCC